MINLSIRVADAGGGGRRAGHQGSSSCEAGSRWPARAQAAEGGLWLGFPGQQPRGSSLAFLATSVPLEPELQVTGRGVLSCVKL